MRFFPISSRSIFLAVGIALALLLLLWLLSGLFSFVAPLFGGLVVLLLTAVVAIAIAIFLDRSVLPPVGGKRNFSSGRRRKPVRVPQTKQEAVSDSLAALERQIGEIQDEVAREVLREQAQEISESYDRQTLQIAIFGTGSSGKTSLANCLLGCMAGETGAPMGTTTASATYRLYLADLERHIEIVDTPGILEAGEAGVYRESEARQIAAAADLLLFVADGDLRRSEWEMLQQLQEIGKRSLVVFNKIDLYPPEEREAILTQLRERTGSDVVAVAAAPQPVQLDTGSVFQLESDIIPLVRRLVAVLRSEGDDLLADSILLRSQRLGEEAKYVLDRQRRRAAEKIVDRYTWIGAGVIACTPLPGIDLLATAAVNAQMVVEIGRTYGCNINFERGKELAVSLGKTLASLGIVKGSFELVAAGLQLHAVTFVASKALQGVAAAYLTRIAGKSFIEYFRRNGDWGDGGIAEVVRQQFLLDKKEAATRVFLQNALERAIEPFGIREPTSDKRER